jgi:hypothetical protein
LSLDELRGIARSAGADDVSAVSLDHPDLAEEKRYALEAMPKARGFASRASMQMSLAQSPAEVARGTLAALGRWGTVRPGFLARFLELSLSFLPRWGRVRMMGVVMGGMTKHHGSNAAPPALSPMKSLRY